jgi:hypothetical protein
MKTGICALAAAAVLTWYGVGTTDVSSERLPGQISSDRDLESTVAAGYAQSPVNGVACQGAYLTTQSCVFTAAGPGPDGVMGTADDTPASCSGVGGPSWNTNRGCTGQNHTNCQGALSNTNYQNKSFFCCQVNLGTCYNVQFPGGPVRACRTNGPYSDVWVGTLNLCQDAGGAVPEG